MITSTKLANPRPLTQSQPIAIQPSPYVRVCLEWINSKTYLLISDQTLSLAQHHRLQYVLGCRTTGGVLLVGSTTELVLLKK